MFEDLVFGALGLGFRSCLGLWEGETQVVGLLCLGFLLIRGWGFWGVRISALQVMVLGCVLV